MLFKKWHIIVGTLVAVLAITTIAYAAHTTIDTNDGQVDVNWNNVSVLSNDGNDIANNNYDIDRAWVANSADNSAFYFRVSLVSSGQLPRDNSSFEARLDCDRNGNFDDGVDVVVYYTFVTSSDEEIVECQGDDYWDCDYVTPNQSDTNADTFGEEIPGTPNNYEWSADINNGDTDWSRCLGNINVQFVSLDGNPTFAIQDTTPWQGYNVPTAVELDSFTAKPSNLLQIVGIVALSIIILLVVSWLTWRFVGRTTLR